MDYRCWHQLFVLMRLKWLRREQRCADVMSSCLSLSRGAYLVYTPLKAVIVFVVPFRVVLERPGR